MFYDVQQLKRRLKPGDVFVVHGRHLLSRVIRVVLDSHWNHATLYLGGGRYIEANHTGVEVKTLDSYRGKDIEIYRHQKLKNEQQKALVHAALSNIGKRYDFLQLIQLFFYFLFGIRGNARAIGTKNRYICSELVAESYAAVGLSCYKNYDSTRISPADFTQSSHFRLCIQRENVLLL